LTNYTFQIHHFDAIDKLLFYKAVQLRIEVFIIEQNCPYQDLDNKDLQAWHLVVMDKDATMLGTLRILPPGISYAEWSIGRVVNAQTERGKGLGKAMMLEAMRFIQEQKGGEAIRISAQEYLHQFYSSLGYVYTGKSYLEDNIPHIEMLWKAR
jgi:ElaA protein